MMNDGIPVPFRIPLVSERKNKKKLVAKSPGLSTRCLKRQIARLTTTKYGISALQLQTGARDRRYYYTHLPMVGVLQCTCYPVIE